MPPTSFSTTKSGSVRGCTAGVYWATPAVQAKTGVRGFGGDAAGRAFATLCAGTTCVVHFVELTAARQLGDAGITWPSRVYAAELLAWDFFLGFALLFAAPTFDANGPERAVRRVLLACGVLCLAGIVGPAVGSMRLQMIGILGYALLLPIVAYLLLRLFARERRLIEDAP